MRTALERWTALVLTLILVLSWMPCGTLAQEMAEPVGDLTQLVSGKYMLLSSDGTSPGCLEEGWLVMAAEQAVWTLDVSEAGVHLTDPAGTPVAPGESDETGLVAGEYRWSVTVSEGIFSFHGIAGELPVTLARCDDLGFRAYDDRLIGEIYDGGFRLYPVTEEENPPETPEEPPEEPENPQDPVDPPKDPENPEDPVEPPEEPEIPEDPVDPPEEPIVPAGPGLFFGVLHSHTKDSDGSGTPAEAYAYAKDVAGLDFLAVTDHSNSFDGEENSSISQDASAISEKWRLGKEAAAIATTGDFLALYGYEMTWQNGLGHISTFFTPGFQSRNQAQYTNFPTALEEYYRTLNTVPGAVSQFNHPGSFYGDFENFGHYSQAADAAMQLIEVVSEGVADYEAYTRALDLGWHLAPTNNQNNHNGLWGTADSGRTVVYAESLTEAGFAAALVNRRVYATEDSDLEIIYKLDGHLLGTMLHRRNVGDTVTLTASISDATDGAVGKVEVIVDGGEVAASAEVAGEVSFTLPASYRYYYLRLTQPDGDIAVTAPVWIEQRQNMQITEFTTDTQLAVKSKPIRVQVTIQNREAESLTVEQLNFTVNGETVATVLDPGTVDANSSRTFTAELTCAAAGAATIRVDAKANIQGEAMESGAELSVTFLTEDMVTTIVADGSHGTLPALTELGAMAAANAMVLVQADALMPEILAQCDILLIPAPERDFESSYVNLIRDYLASGRTLILCGQSDTAMPDCADRLNALAEALNLTARFRDDTTFDPVNNGGTSGELFTSVYPGAFGASGPFCQLGGCTLNPGTGSVLVMGMDTTFSIDGDGDGVGNLEETYTEVVEGVDVIRTLVTRPGEGAFVVREQTASGASVYLSGGMFAADDALDPGGANPWDEPNGNGTLMEAILDIRPQTVVLKTIAQARDAAQGETVRTRGYVTVGTAVEANRFPGMIYIQDDTAGLAVLDFNDAGVSVGTHLELYLLRTEEGFQLLHWEETGETPYNVQPEVISCKDAADGELYPDRLIQAEGKVIARTLTADKKGVSSFTLEDKNGNRVTVLVEDGIQSASTGQNTLAQIVEEDAWVSAVGIQYRSGQDTVIRVRNCDEVVVVREKEIVYRVVDGEYTVWIRKDGKSIYMEVEGPAEEFLGIEVDGQMIDQSHYQTTLHGNLFFRIWPRYLKTLEAGKHSVVFKFRDGEAKARLVVWNYADSPYTGDPAGIWFAAMLLSGTALVGIRKKRARR